MSKILRLLILSVILTASISSFSQSYYNSPYSRYGIGDIDRSGFGMNRAMGGISVCLREPNQVNYLNPASHNAQDTMSFIWDVGAWGSSSISKNSLTQGSRTAFNINHISMSFPVFKNYYASAGLVPFSTTGYNIKEVDVTNTYDKITYLYTGSGNINQFYIANSVGLLKKHLNLGINASYLFGSLNNNVEHFYPFISDYSTIKARSSMVGGVYLNFGAQGVFDLSNDIQMVTGVTYSPKTNIDVEYSEELFKKFSNIESSHDTIYTKSLNGNFVIPGLLGLGVSAKLKDKLLVGVDYYYQDWSKATFLNANDSLLKSNRLSLGLQYVPDKGSYRSYLERIHYRAGAYFYDSYLKLKGQPISDYGVSVGLGLPFRNNGTMFHLGVEMGKKGTTSNGLVQINYTRVTFSVTLYDFWFYKRKID